MLKFVETTIHTEKVNLLAVDSELSGTQSITFPVDKHLHEFIVSLSGEEPTIELIDPTGKSKPIFVREGFNIAVNIFLITRKKGNV